VRITEQNWLDHVEKHPEIESYHGDIPTVLQDPHVVYRATEDEVHHFYRLGIGKGRLRNLYLRVIVTYSESGEGWIKTVFFTTQANVPGGRLLRFRHPTQGDAP
jgi:hypothetical protein